MARAVEHIWLSSTDEGLSALNTFKFVRSETMKQSSFVTSLSSVSQRTLVREDTSSTQASDDTLTP